jgi:hypothetical protein
VNLQLDEVCFTPFHLLILILRCSLNQHATGKSFAEDLTEGKFSFPVVHSVRADRSNRQVISKYRSHYHPSVRLIVPRCPPEATLDAHNEEIHHRLHGGAYEVLRVHIISA